MNGDCRDEPMSESRISNEFKGRRCRHAAGNLAMVCGDVSSARNFDNRVEVACQLSVKLLAVQWSCRKNFEGYPSTFEWMIHRDVCQENLGFPSQCSVTIWLFSGF